MEMNRQKKALEHQRAHKFQGRAQPPLICRRGGGSRRKTASEINRFFFFSVFRLWNIFLDLGVTASPQKKRLGWAIKESGRRWEGCFADLSLREKEKKKMLKQVEKKMSRWQPLLALAHLWWAALAVVRQCASSPVIAAKPCLSYRYLYNR